MYVCMHVHNATNDPMPCAEAGLAMIAPNVVHFSSNIVLKVINPFTGVGALLRPTRSVLFLF